MMKEEMYKELSEKVKVEVERRVRDFELEGRQQGTGEAEWVRR